MSAAALAAALAGIPHESTEQATSSGGRGSRVDVRLPGGGVFVLSVAKSAYALEHTEADINGR